MVLDWLFEGQNAARLGKGLLLTAQISLISVALSCVFGTLFGLMLRADNRIVRFIGRLYLETVRIVPILVWLFGFYFGFATWTGIHIDGLWVCIWVFVLWGVAEMGDLVRGALESIEKHQVESGLAIGLSRWQVFRFIELPQSVRRVLPGSINLFTRMIKTSSLAALIDHAERFVLGLRADFYAVFPLLLAAVVVGGEAGTQMGTLTWLY